MNRLARLVAIVSLALLASPLLAQTSYPNKPVKIIVPFGAGGSTDMLARTIGNSIQKATRQSFVVENKPGASGIIGATTCKQAAPDGYTLCMFIGDIIVINPFTFKKLSYDAEKDFVPAAFVGDAVAGLTVSASLPVRNLKELIEYSKANPGKVYWGSYGIGTASHLLLEAINQSSGAGITHVPYKSVPDINTGLVGGQIQSSMMAVGLYEQFVKEGKMRHIAVMGEKRAPDLPDVATVSEQGVEFKAVPWFGLFAPAGTPQAIVDRVNALVSDALADPAVAKTISSQGYVLRNVTNAEFADLIRRDRGIWGPIAKSLGLALE